jgi:hypothetical protein
MSDDLVKQFFDAINSNSTRTILELLKTVDPSVKGNLALRKMAVKGNLPIIIELLKDPRVNSIDDLHVVLFHAVNYGHFDVVDYMLGDPRIDPTKEITTADSFINTPIRFILNIACRRNNERIINRLLEDQRIVEWVRNDVKENNGSWQAVAIAYENFVSAERAYKNSIAYENFLSAERIYKKISDLLEQTDVVAP